MVPLIEALAITGRNIATATGMAPWSRQQPLLPVEKVRNAPLEIVLTIIRQKSFGFWESFGFEVEEFPNHLDETLVVVTKLQQDGCADVSVFPLRAARYIQTIY